jgi:hypothetical protein
MTFGTLGAMSVWVRLFAFGFKDLKTQVVHNDVVDPILEIVVQVVRSIAFALNALAQAHQLVAQPLALKRVHELKTLEIFQ